MPLPIVHYGDPILRKKGAPVTEFNAELARLADDMIETMHEAYGIGLAAQQIGLALQFCVIDLRGAEADFHYTLDGATPPLDLIMPMALANPEVTLEPEPTTVYEEGCLSFPGINGDVIRPDRTRVVFQDLQGVRHEMICNGLLGRCIQHEVDHLNGILFIDRMEKDVLAAIEPDTRRLKKETRRRLRKS
ncbi:MAG: peptide deformylase [Verrucomicrobia bacterium]|nr:MAG: peptide deformylase [Verrucomicrobiota bacterium]